MSSSSNASSPVQPWKTVLDITLAMLIAFPCIFYFVLSAPPLSLFTSGGSIISACVSVVTSTSLLSSTGKSADGAAIHTEANLFPTTSALDALSQMVLTVSYAHIWMAMLTFVVLFWGREADFGKLAVDRQDSQKGGWLRRNYYPRIAWLMQESPTLIATALNGIVVVCYLVITVTSAIAADAPRAPSASHSASSPASQEGKAVAGAKQQCDNGKELLLWIFLAVRQLCVVLPVILYVVHYLQRVFCYPLFVMRKVGGTPVPAHISILACLYCVFNGHLQSFVPMYFACLLPPPLISSSSPSSLYILCLHVRDVVVKIIIMVLDLDVHHHYFGHSAHADSRVGVGGDMGVSQKQQFMKQQHFVSFFSTLCVCCVLLIAVSVAMLGVLVFAFGMACNVYHDYLISSQAQQANSQCLLDADQQTLQQDAQDSSEDTRPQMNADPKREVDTTTPASRSQSTYIIPTGGLFSVISCPNLAGEMVEWIGYALACFGVTLLIMTIDVIRSALLFFEPSTEWTFLSQRNESFASMHHNEHTNADISLNQFFSVNDGFTKLHYVYTLCSDVWRQYAVHCLPAVSFAVYVVANLVPRAVASHQWYLRKFGQDYKQLNRKAFLPYIW